ncbi:Hypothetical protein, putative [Bodo saltans]|uniref:Uncharacterized protein n=1 Tax=Bodo saltans TaxID=75058 RepID=A0A0S4J7S6_BODSA|nr:Hypothetical protein, putative [Bodo saltans]|eukprot:CUG87292.1 Hypothetical protein, putative [Bodo saltans]
MQPLYSTSSWTIAEVSSSSSAVGDPFSLEFSPQDVQDFMSAFDLTEAEVRECVEG